MKPEATKQDKTQTNRQGWRGDLACDTPVSKWVNLSPRSRSYMEKAKYGGMPFRSQHWGRREKGRSHELSGWASLVYFLSSSLVRISVSKRRHFVPKEGHLRVSSGLCTCTHMYPDIHDHIPRANKTEVVSDDRNILYYTEHQKLDREKVDSGVHILIMCI